MQGCIGIGASHGFLISGNNIVVLVTVTVILHCTALSQRTGGFRRDVDYSVSVRLGRKGTKLDRIYRLSHIAAASRGNMLYRIGIYFKFHSALFFKESESAFNGGNDLRRRNRLEFKDRRAAENGVVNVKIRIFRC